MSTCIHGHDEGRDSSGHCKVCRNEYKKVYYRKYPKKRNAQRYANRQCRKIKLAKQKLDIIFANQLAALRDCKGSSHCDSWNEGRL